MPTVNPPQITPEAVEAQRKQDSITSKEKIYLQALQRIIAGHSGIESPEDQVHWMWSVANVAVQSANGLPDETGVFGPHLHCTTCTCGTFASPLKASETPEQRRAAIEANALADAHRRSERSTAPNSLKSWRREFHSRR